MKTPTIIIGAGYTGLAAAYDLARNGVPVTVIEQEQEIGGLAGTFQTQPGIHLEKFYHHWFTSDRAVLDLISELGLGDHLLPCSTRTGLYFANSIFRLASPLDLLRFPALPFPDRVRTGLMALYARAISNWRPLEQISAKEWLIQVGGQRAFNVIWAPLLHGKFGSEADNVSAVWIWNKLKLRGSSRNSKGSETLVYLKGGFGRFAETLREKLVALGVQFQLGTALKEVVADRSGVQGVVTNHGTIAASQVLATIPLPDFLDRCPVLPAPECDRWRSIRFLGNVCLVLRLRRSLSSTYWLNVADPNFPFVGVIEHTNLDDRAHYGGEHIAYLSKYLSTSDPLFAMERDEVLAFAMPHLKRMFPAFSEDWIIDAHLWRARHSQPVITRNYSECIPPFRLPVRGLWLCTMAQVYPQDRGTNYAVEYGRRVAEAMLVSPN